MIKSKFYTILLSTIAIFLLIFSFNGMASSRGGKCSPSNCETVEGIMACFGTYEGFEKYADANGEQFFKRDPITGGLFMKEVEFPVQYSKTEVTSTGRNITSHHTSFEKKNIPVIRRGAYHMVKRLSESNQRCLQSFAEKNCVRTKTLTKRDIESQMHIFRTSTEITNIDEEIYTGNELKAMDMATLEDFTKRYLISKNKIREFKSCSAAESPEGAAKRMLCTLAKDMVKVTPMCLNFDPARDTAR